MGGCLQNIVFVILEIVVGRLLDELLRRLTGRRVRLGWLALFFPFIGLFGPRRRN